MKILLPADKLPPDLASRAKEGVKRYCGGKLQYIEHDISATRWRGFRSLLVALVALFAFIGAARLVFNEETPILQIISEEVAIAGWIALSFPLERLSFSLWGHRLDRKTYDLLMDMELTIQAEE